MNTVTNFKPRKTLTFYLIQPGYMQIFIVLGLWKIHWKKKKKFKTIHEFILAELRDYRRWSSRSEVEQIKRANLGGDRMYRITARTAEKSLQRKD